MDERRIKSSQEKTKSPEKAENLNSFHIDKIDDSLAEEILDRTEIHGSFFNDRLLTREILKQEGLLPRYKIDLDPSTVLMSSLPYDLGEGRLAVVGFTQTQDVIVARSYYRSNSSGVWRYLPKYTLTPEGEISWYDKGYGEQSITLPAQAQRFLAEISKEDSVILNIKDPEFVFAGTARTTHQTGTYRLEVSSEPLSLHGNFYPSGGSRIRPELLKFNDPQSSPDFANLVMSWKQSTSLYGEIEIEVFDSIDKRVRFMFCRDSKGRAWIGGAEPIEGLIQTTGLKQKWIHAGNLATPAYEYKEEAGGYGNHDMTFGDYVDMYKNYLIKVPVIQEYLRARHPELAPKPELPQISDAKSVEELYEILRNKKVIKGSQDTFTAEELIILIEGVLLNRGLIEDITRTEGLRAKVQELIDLRRRKGRMRIYYPKK